MKIQMKDLAKKVFNSGVDGLSERERRVIQHVADRLHISQNTNRQFDEKLTFGQRLADRVAAFGGSWTFIMIFGATLLTWVVLNSYILARRGATFDPYPYILLNLFLSMIAALQAPVIMMSQNRQASKDRLDAAHDYEVNLKAELEILGLHEKLDSLREQQWTELILMQQEQIKLLTRLLDERGNEGMKAKQ
ncbi:MAG: hypothetical protein QOJ02_1142 [Acidobacteriota bacterium]|jgi:uncharacterized membrane protein|nr:hypothetical protein [Acidobacteriota bacterium]